MMKKLITLVFGLCLLAACTPSGKDSVTVEAPPSQVDPFAGMSEDEKIAQMIKLIEKEEARMETDGEL